MNHRIENLIIEPFEERRVQGNLTIRELINTGLPDRRSTPHDYSTKKELVTVYVPVEPEPPEWADNGTILDDKLARFWDSRDFKNAEYAQKKEDVEIPFSPDDKIVAMSNDSDCACINHREAKYIVEKVLGVGERKKYIDVSDNHTVLKKWHFKLLCEET